MMALFEMATLEMWLSIMYDGVDAVGVDKQPVLNNNPYISIFFVIFIIVGAFFILNLIVGVIIDKVGYLAELYQYLLSTRWTKQLRNSDIF